MMPSVHFDTKACNDALQAYMSIADECPNIVKNGAIAEAAILAEINEFKKLVQKQPAPYTDMIKERQTALQQIADLARPAKAAEKTADRLSGALSQLNNHLKAFGGGEPRKAAYLLYVKKLQVIVAREMSLVRPPRPMSGPPVPAKH